MPRYGYDHRFRREGWSRRYDLGYTRGLIEGRGRDAVPPRVRYDRGFLAAGRYGPAYDRDLLSRGHSGTYFMGGYSAPYDREQRGRRRR